MKQKIILLSGIPASGKSTYSKQFVKDFPNFIRINADEIRGELANGDESDQSNNGIIFNKIIPTRLEEAIISNNSVIIDVTAVDIKARKRFIQLAKFLKVDIESHYIIPNLEKAKLWNSNRDRKVPEFVLENMSSRWITPSVNEGFTLTKEITL